VLDVKEEMASTWDCRSMWENQDKKTFAYIKDKIWKAIQGWKKKMLPRVGKEILIKACAQAIPVFAMTCFDITKGLCDQINSMVSRFFWAS
jgi:hypothetical protein